MTTQSAVLKESPTMVVRTSHFRGLPIPLVLEPEHSDEPSKDFNAWLPWFRDHQAFLADQLRNHGALLFRGFHLHQVEDFQALVATFGDEKLDYIGGVTPRNRVKGTVYTSTEVTRHYKIQIHNEMSYQKLYPSKIFFFSKTVAAEGGETIIADSRAILRDIPDAIVEKFRNKKLKYVQVLHKKTALRQFLKKWLFFYVHLNWEDTFGTADRREVEEICQERGMDFRWRANGDLETSSVLPGVVTHPETLQTVWFNQANMQHFNPRACGWPLFLLRKAMYRSARNLPNQVYFGDGSPLKRSDLDAVYEAIDRNTIAFPWQEGDVLLLDNVLVGHGRNPFKGKRSVLVSMLGKGRATA